ncbi:L,D-transpeptidase family protein [Shewanella morhuae]|uniref:Murein L,D-transpeptidase n=1 Tax=Shewanella morhuae TaxID=365591 RepID=A0A379ZS97_9GAMM|nr:L,D-transpeptidase family protein [Shewanella morhuae]SUI67475.1 murein L,D-transpeptidase [Shewanella morhuae]
MVLQKIIRSFYRWFDCAVVILVQHTFVLSKRTSNAIKANRNKRLSGDRLAALLCRHLTFIVIVILPFCVVNAADEMTPLNVTHNTDNESHTELSTKLSTDLYAIEPEPQLQLEALMPQVLLLDLAGVNPLFSQDYRELVASPNTLSMADLARIQANVASYWRYVTLLTACNDTGTVEATSAVIPMDTPFQSVLKQITHLVQLDRVEPWETLVSDEKLTVGMSNHVIDIIAKRLQVLGDLTTWPDMAQVYTEELMVGIKRFQLRHGLKQDGVIGKKTLYWLNQSPKARAVLLAKNTIRKRLFERKLASSYLLINIPAFEMILVDNGTKVLKSKVIVGKPSRQTPLLDSQISSIVLNPDWRVPSSILRRDILPQIKKNGHYLSERQFDVYDYNGQLVQHTPEEWQALASTSFPYKLVQRPGTKNALGKYKFHFENSFSVYLHDTSEPSLFNKENRALSSGCIRIEKVTELAQWFKEHLVKDKRLWDKLVPEITHAQWFALSEKLPVHLVYWTAWLEDNGQDHYRSDIYNLEPELTNAVPAAVLDIR